jgi:hypothetical protein
MSEGDGISTLTFALMMLVAGIIDATQAMVLLIPLVGPLFGVLIGPILSVTAFSIFWLWFSAHGIYIMRGKNMTRSWITLIVEFIPEINDIVPGWSFFVLRTVIAHWRSERTGTEV